MKKTKTTTSVLCGLITNKKDSAKAKLEDYVTAYPDDEKAAKEAEFLKTR